MRVFCCSSIREYKNHNGNFPVNKLFASNFANFHDQLRYVSLLDSAERLTQSTADD